MNMRGNLRYRGIMKQDLQIGSGPSFNPLVNPVPGQSLFKIRTRIRIRKPGLNIYFCRGSSENCNE